MTLQLLFAFTFPYCSLVVHYFSRGISTDSIEGELAELSTTGRGFTFQFEMLLIIKGFAFISRYFILRSVTLP